MKKLYLLLGLIILSVGCSKNVGAATVACDSQISSGARETFTIDAFDNDVTMMKHVLTFRYTGEGEAQLETFQGSMKQLKHDLEQDLAKHEEQIGRKIPGYTLTFNLSDTSLEITCIQNFKEIDFDLMNELGFYSGYNREVHGLFLDEEVKTFKQNGFVCETTKI